MHVGLTANSSSGQPRRPAGSPRHVCRRTATGWSTTRMDSGNPWRHDLDHLGGAQVGQLTVAERSLGGHCRDRAGVDRPDVLGAGAVRCARMEMGCGVDGCCCAPDFDPLSEPPASARKSVCSRSPRVRTATCPIGQSSVVSTKTNDRPFGRTKRSPSRTGMAAAASMC